jgi:hypothetical protein
VHGGRSSDNVEIPTNSIASSAASGTPRRIESPEKICGHAIDVDASIVRIRPIAAALRIT